MRIIFFFYADQLILKKSVIAASKSAAIYHWGSSKTVKYFRVDGEFEFIKNKIRLLLIV